MGSKGEEPSSSMRSRFSTRYGSKNLSFTSRFSSRAVSSGVGREYGRMSLTTTSNVLGAWAVIGTEDAPTPINPHHSTPVLVIDGHDVFAEPAPRRPQKLVQPELPGAPSTMSPSSIHAAWS